MQVNLLAGYDWNNIYGHLPPVTATHSCLLCQLSDVLTSNVLFQTGLELNSALIIY